MRERSGYLWTVSDPIGELARVQGLVDGQNWDEALRAVGPLRREHPELPDVWRLQALALRGAGHTVEAVVAAERWRRLAPESRQAEALYRDLEVERLVEKAREAEIARQEIAQRYAGRGLPQSDFPPGGYADRGLGGPLDPFDPDGFASGGAFVEPDSHRRHPGRFRLIAAVVVAAVVLSPMVISRWRVVERRAVTGDPGPSSVAGESAGRVPDRQSADVPNPVRPSSGGSWEFLNEYDGEPVRHDPCTTIHYVVRVGSGPPDAIEIAREAVARVSDATGLSFVYDGTTDRVPRSVSRSELDSDDPLVIAWVLSTETDLFDDVEVGESSEAVGVGGPILMRRSDGAQWYVGGFVAIRSDAAVGPGFGPGTSEGNVLLHELGHVVGLGHVDDANELMAPWTTDDTRAGYGPGDLYGLWRLGASQGCL